MNVSLCSSETSRAPSSSVGGHAGTEAPSGQALAPSKIPKGCAVSKTPPLGALQNSHAHFLVLEL